MIVISYVLVRIFHLSSWGGPLLLREPAELQALMEASTSLRACDTPGRRSFLALVCVLTLGGSKLDVLSYSLQPTRTFVVYSLQMEVLSNFLASRTLD